MSDPRDAFIQRVVQGRSFADVGGLWGVVNEKVSVAHKAGARQVAMLDISVPDSPLWPQFRDRMRGQGVPACREVIVDIAEYHGERFDVVHCSGVLYHHPNPMMLLSGLRRATGEHLVLTSAVTQHEISNELGTYRVQPSGAILVPALNAKERAVLAEYWSSIGAGVQGITEPARYLVHADNTFDAGPWWWLPTPECMEAMACAAGFRVVDRSPAWNNNAHVALLQAI
jgi:hypothetical protein